MARKRQIRIDPSTKAQEARPDRDHATPERLAHAGDVEIIANITQRILAAPLDRLHKAGAITHREFQAGDQFRSDAYLVAHDPGAPSIDWTGAGRSTMSSRVPAALLNSTEAIVMARQAMTSARKAITGLPWVILERGLIREDSLETIGRRVFGSENERDAISSGRAGFRVALCGLADHYAL